MRSRRDFRLSRKPPRRLRPQMKVNPRKLKVSGFPSPRLSRSGAAKRPNSIRRVLSGWSCRANSSNLARIASKKTASVVFMLKAQYQIVGVAHNDHVAGGLVPSPALGPEIENVVQVDAGKQRRYYRTLPGSPVTDRHCPVFQDTRLKPFLDQPSASSSRPGEARAGTARFNPRSSNRSKQGARPNQKCEQSVAAPVLR